MQFAPAWLKKPNGAVPGGSTNAGAATIGQPQPTSQNEDFSGLAGFPLPGARQGGNVPAQNGLTNSFGQSYSQIASPRNENFPSNMASGAVQLADVVNGSSTTGDNKARPFRYSREAMLALFDEDKIKERPLELTEWATHRSNNSGHAGTEDGGVTSIILSDKAGLPMGLVEWTVEEKKVSITSSCYACKPFSRFFFLALCKSHSSSTRARRSLRLFSCIWHVRSPKRPSRQRKRTQNSWRTRFRPRGGWCFRWRRLHLAIHAQWRWWWIRLHHCGT